MPKFANFLIFLLIATYKKYSNNCPLHTRNNNNYSKIVNHIQDFLKISLRQILIFERKGAEYMKKLPFLDILYILVPQNV